MRDFVAGVCCGTSAMFAVCAFGLTYRAALLALPTWVDVAAPVFAACAGALLWFACAQLAREDNHNGTL